MAYKQFVFAFLSMALSLPVYADASDLIRLSDPEDLLGWEAVGRIDVARGGYCTGALIGKNLVLTAAHCIFKPGTDTQVSPENLIFKAGLRDGKVIDIAQGMRAVAHKSYNPLGGVYQENIRYDVALIQLRKPIASFTASPFVLHSGAPKDNLVSVVSYGKGRDEALSWQKECAVIGRQRGVMAFDCAATFGSSGSPVFVKENGKNRILSVISSIGKSEGKAVSFGMELPEIVQQLKIELLNADTIGFKKSTSSLRFKSTGDGRKTSGAKFIKN